MKDKWSLIPMYIYTKKEVNYRVKYLIYILQKYLPLSVSFMSSLHPILPTHTAEKPIKENICIPGLKQRVVGAL